MAIKFNVIQKSEPGIAGGGNKKFYASAVSSGERNIVDLTKSIEKISTVSGADIRAVLYALVDVISDDLANGQIIRLGEFGTFRISLGSEGFAEEKSVNSSSIKTSKILFNPGQKLKDTLALLKFEKSV